MVMGAIDDEAELFMSDADVEERAPPDRLRRSQATTDASPSSSHSPRGGGAARRRGNGRRAVGSDPAVTSAATTAPTRGRPPGSKNLPRTTTRERRALPDRASRVRSFVDLEHGAVDDGPVSDEIPLLTPSKRPRTSAMPVRRSVVQVVEDKRDGMDAQYLHDMQQAEFGSHSAPSPVSQLDSSVGHTVEVGGDTRMLRGEMLDEDGGELDEETVTGDAASIVIQHSAMPRTSAASAGGAASPQQIVFHQYGENMWPLYSEAAIDFPTACEIILNSIHVAVDQVCHTTPQAYSDSGTFVVDLSGFVNRHEIAVDGLGAWGKPQGSARFYRYLRNARDVERVDPGETFDVKVLCNRYTHPGTNDSRGRFVRKIYTATTSNTAGGGPLPMAVVVYEWTGEPHPIRVFDPAIRAAQRPFGNRSWESAVDSEPPDDGGQIWNGYPLFAKTAVDFETVARIILGAMPISSDRICLSIPQSYRLDGTFLIDMRHVSDSQLRKDGNGSWGKPSGCSRYYKVDAVTNDAIRVDRGHQMPNEHEYDIQILSKRYEHEDARAHGRFVRKIYVGKSRESKHLQSCCTLAVITYCWKGGNPVGIGESETGRGVERGASEAARMKRAFVDAPLLSSSNDGEPLPLDSLVRDVPRLQRAIPVSQNARVTRGRFVPSSHKTDPSTGTQPLAGLVLSHADHVKRLTLAKELENQNRLAAILERAEAFLDRFEADDSTRARDLHDDVESFVDGGEVGDEDDETTAIMWNVPGTELDEQAANANANTGNERRSETAGGGTVRGAQQAGRGARTQRERRTSSPDQFASSTADADHHRLMVSSSRYAMPNLPYQ